MNTATIQQRIMHRYRWLLVLTSILVSILLVSSGVHAQTPDDTVQITLSPTNRTVDIQPGKTYNGSFAIFNSGKAKLDFTVYAAPYRVKNQSYDPVFTESQDKKEQSRTQISRWVSFEKTEYTLKPGENVSVNYSITTPDSIPDGGQYAALFAQTKSSGSSSILSQKRVGMLLYAHSNGKTINKGTSQDPNLKFWQTAPIFTVNQPVTNSGNTDFTAKAKLSISDIFGNEKYTANSKKAILPDTTRDIELNWQHAPALSLMRVKSSVTIFDKTTTYEHIVLFATPTAVLGVVTIIMLIVAGGVYVFRHKSAHKK